MRKVMLSVLILCLLPEAYAADKLPEVQKLENGFYISRVDGGSISALFDYIVDSTAGICFIARYFGDTSNLEVVSCESLKKRPEWARIITWK